MSNPNFYIHNFDTPRVYPLPVDDDVACWQLASVNGDAVGISGYHGYSGFYTDFKFDWNHDGSEVVKFNGFGSPGGPVLKTYDLDLFATHGS
ncbi:MAG: hypothetical protein PHE55_05600 [Methylococcaceae bacterium]|nr:hypothetical protein [Methylococcaceae bacterium]